MSCEKDYDETLMRESNDKHNYRILYADRIRELEAALAAANAEIARLNAELSPLGLPAPFILRQTDNTKEE